jgi:uncharacterized repeat protein (TIGR03943 family)
MIKGFWVHAAWLAGIAWLLLSGQCWAFLAPAGCVLLGLAGLVFLAFAATELRDRAKRASCSSTLKTWPQALILLCPLAFLAFVPATPAGSYSFQNRAGMQRFAPGQSGQNGASRAEGPPRTGAMTVLDLCQGFPDNCGQRVVTEGMVHFAEGLPRGTFVLFRFVITCCTADAQPVGVLVKTPKAADLKPDTWVRVEGVIEKMRVEGDEVPTIATDRIEVIPTPARPYLY